MVVFQSRWKHPFYSSKYGTDLSPRFDTPKDRSTWIGKYPCMQIVFWQVSRNNSYLSIPGKILEVHLHAWLFSNPHGKVLIIVGILLSLDLRVQPINVLITVLYGKPDLTVTLWIYYRKFVCNYWFLQFTKGLCKIFLNFCLCCTVL